jgi:hypothetical protein
MGHRLGLLDYWKVPRSDTSGLITTTEAQDLRSEVEGVVSRGLLVDCQGRGLDLGGLVYAVRRKGGVGAL